MADSAVCDRCGADLLGADVHYFAELRIWAAYDTMEIGSRGSLSRRELRDKYIDALIDASQQSEQEAMDSVYWQRRFDLCAKCRRELQTDPLGSGASEPHP